MAVLILTVFTLPILTFSPSLNRNVKNSGAKQLSRKVFRGAEPLLIRSPEHASNAQFSRRHKCCELQSHPLYEGACSWMLRDKKTITLESTQRMQPARASRLPIVRAALPNRSK